MAAGAAGGLLLAGLGGGRTRGLLASRGLLAGLGGGFQRADEDVRVAALQARQGLYAAVRSQIGGEPHEQLLAQVGVCDFAAPELHHGLDAIAFRQEPDSVIHLEVVVMVVGVGAELQFLDLDHVLLLLGVVLLLFLLVLIVPEIHDLGHRGDDGRRHQNQVEAQFLRSAEGGGCRHHFRGAVRKHGAYFTRANELVYVLSAILPARRKISSRIHVSDSFGISKVSGHGQNARRDALVKSRNGAHVRQAGSTSVTVYTKKARWVAPWRDSMPPRSVERQQRGRIGLVEKDQHIVIGGEVVGV